MGDYIRHLVGIFRGVKRVLRDDGTVWLNLGDSYSSGIGANLVDCLKSLHKSNAMIFRNLMAIGISSHGIDVSNKNQGFPYGELFSLFGVKRVTIKQRDNDFCQVIYPLTDPAYCWIVGRLAAMTMNAANLEIVLDKGYNPSIIVSDLNSHEMAVLGIAPRSMSMIHGDTTLTIEKAAKPIAECIRDGETIGDTISFNAPLKRLPDIYLVDDAIPFPDCVARTTKFVGDLKVVKAGRKHFTLFRQDCGVNISARFVTHDCYLSVNGCLLRYDSVYAEASQLSNTRKAKQLLGIPDMIKRALMRDGWICRSVIIWAKGLSFCDTYSGSVMPESVRDRPTTSYEYLLLLSKQRKYFYDSYAVRELGSLSHGSQRDSVVAIELSNLLGQCFVFIEKLRAQHSSMVSGRSTKAALTNACGFLGACIGDSSLTFEASERQYDLRLSAFDSEIGQQRTAYMGGFGSRTSPVIARASIIMLRLIQGDIAPEQFLHEVYCLWVALPENNMCKETWRLAFANKTPADGNSERTVRVHNPSHIGKLCIGHVFDTSNEHYNTSAAVSQATGRNLRNVWVINPEPLRQKHFAAYPSKLVEPCIKAGTSERGCCPECGKPHTRIIEKTGHINKREPAHAPRSGPTKTDSTGWAPTSRATDSWRPGCSCSAGDPIPCVVLDCFSGAGTSVMVALRLGRRAIGIDLSEEYCRMARKRIIDDCPMLNIPGEAT